MRTSLATGHIIKEMRIPCQTRLQHVGGKPTLNLLTKEVAPGVFGCSEPLRQHRAQVFLSLGSNSSQSTMQVGSGCRFGRSSSRGTVRILACAHEGWGGIPGARSESVQPAAAAACPGPPQSASRLPPCSRHPRQPLAAQRLPAPRMPGTSSAKSVSHAWCSGRTPGCYRSPDHTAKSQISWRC